MYQFTNDTHGIHFTLTSIQHDENRQVLIHIKFNDPYQNTKNIDQNHLISNDMYQMRDILNNICVKSVLICIKCKMTPIKGTSIFCIIRQNAANT